MSKHDLSSAEARCSAGEPLTEPTATWIAGAMGKPVIDNYWQTETGWPILAICNGVGPATDQVGSPDKFRAYDVRSSTRPAPSAPAGQERVRGAVEGPAAAGLPADHLWRTTRIRQTYWSTSRPLQDLRLGVRDEDGYTRTWPRWRWWA